MNFYLVIVILYALASGISIGWLSSQRFPLQRPPLTRENLTMALIIELLILIWAFSLWRAS